MKTLYTMNNVYNQSQNDWLSASKAVGFSHHDPNRHTNNASGFPLVPNTIGGNGPSQNDWLAPTQANGFSRLLHGGRSLGVSKVEAPNSTNFMPRGSDIVGAGKVSLLDTAGPVITKSSKLKGKKTEFKPRGSDIQRGFGERGTLSNPKDGTSSTKTPFKYTGLYTANYNMPSVKGDPLMYGNTTLGLVPDLGVNVQPLRQAYFHSGL